MFQIVSKNSFINALFYPVYLQKNVIKIKIYWKYAGCIIPEKQVLIAVKLAFKLQM